MKIRIKNILTTEPVGQTLTVSGWVRTKRDTGSFSFVEINDGSCLGNLQVIAADSNERLAVSVGVLQIRKAQ